MSYYEKLLSENKDGRISAINSLNDIVEHNPEKLYSEFSLLLDILSRIDDEFVILQLSTIIKTLTEKNNDLVINNTIKFSQLLKKLSEFDLSNDESMIVPATINILSILTPQFTLNSQSLLNNLETLFVLMGKKSNVKWSAYNPIIPIIMNSPQILKNHVTDIFAVLDNMPILLSLISSMYNMNQEVFENNINKLIDIYQKDSTQQTSVISILYEISKSNPKILVDKLEIIKSALLSPTNSTIMFQILAELSRDYPENVYLYLKDVKQSISMFNSAKIMAPNTLSLIGRYSMEYAKEVLPILVGLLESDQQVISLVLPEIRNVIEIEKELIEPYLPKINQLLEDPQETIRDNSQAIIDFYEGRDLKSLANKIEDQNKKIKEIVKSVDDLREYVDDNLDMLKEFIAEIIKKLPVPSSFSTAGRIRKTIILNFNCYLHTDRCLYPTDRSFTTESKMWNKWLKLAFSAVKIGKSALLPPSPGDVVKELKNVYDQYKSKNEEDFLEFMSEPFLTSDEQDNLINQLRDANYFNVFNYDAQNAEWHCIMCNP